MTDDEGDLLALLNSAPIVDGARVDGLDGADGRALARALGGVGSAGEVDALRGVREALKRVVRGDGGVEGLEPFLAATLLRPSAQGGGEVLWEVATEGDLRPAARVVVAWDRVSRARPGRLKPCANPECDLYLIDRSRPGTARWCSMATCGNRLKVRAHAQRRREPGP